MKQEFTQPQSPIPLPVMKRGDFGQVVALEGDESTQNRLRELGLFEDAQVSILHVNGSILCQVKDSRFGLCRSIAQHVLVAPTAL